MRIASYFHFACFRRACRKYKSLPPSQRTINNNPSIRCKSKDLPLDGISFSFSEDLDKRKDSTCSTISYHSALDNISCRSNHSSDSSRESDNSLYHLPCAPKQFMDSSVHSDDNYLSAMGRESDQLSLSSTTSSCGYPRRPDSGGVPLYMPMNRGAHSPGSNNKVSVSYSFFTLDLIWIWICK